MRHWWNRGRRAFQFFFDFMHFWRTMAKIIDLCTPFRVGASVWKILYPPLRGALGGGRRKISGEGFRLTGFPRRGAKVLFSTFFSENCMKIIIIESRGGHVPSKVVHPPSSASLGPQMAFDSSNLDARY